MKKTVTHAGLRGMLREQLPVYMPENTEFGYNKYPLEG